MYVDATGENSFLDDEIHGGFSCIDCHGGESGILTKEEAHVGMDPDPSDGPDETCATACHAAELGHYWQSSVHATQVGYFDLFEKRSGMKIEDHPEFQEGFNKGCAACHASCGDCHISQPKNVGGGLVNGHRINRTPDQVRNCTACHGSRVGDEYTGTNTYARASMHFLKRMKCVDCHGGSEMHGPPGADPKHRYEEPALPTCDDCHDVTTSPNSWHVMHAGDTASGAGRELQCQVCHSQDYKSCNSCHVGEGITGSSYQTFKIGKNPIKDLNGWDYAVLRHIPVSEDTYTGWGLTDLPNYSDVETWKYTSPHNIRRFTDRTDTTGGKNGCADCHGTEDSPQGWFLRASDLTGLSPAEQAANQHVIVPNGNATLWPE